MKVALIQMNNQIFWSSYFQFLRRPSGILVPLLEIIYIIIIKLLKNWTRRLWTVIATVWTWRFAIYETKIMMCFSPSERILQKLKNLIPAANYDIWPLFRPNVTIWLSGVQIIIFSKAPRPFDRSLTMKIFTRRYIYCRLPVMKSL